jgi:hypothetical protein
MRPNFEVRPGAVAHLALAQGHPCSQAYEAYTHFNIEKLTIEKKKTIIFSFIFILFFKP